MFNFLKKKNDEIPGNNNGIQNNQLGTGSDFLTNTNQFGNNNNNMQGQDNSFNNGFNNGFGNGMLGKNPQEPGKNFGEPDRFNPENAQHFNEEPEPMQSGGYNQYLGPREQQSQTIGNDIHESTKHSYELLSKSIEVMNSKLDSIRFSLDSINQRIANIERIAYDEKNTQRSNNQW